MAYTPGPINSNPTVPAWDTDASYVSRNASNLAYEEELGSQSVFACLHGDVWHAIKTRAQDKGV